MPQDDTRSNKTDIDAIDAEVRRYVPKILPRLALTYGLPMVLLLTVGAILVPGIVTNIEFLQPSTRSILVFAAMLMILVYGWRYLEPRTQATSLFSAYVSYSSARRRLKKQPSDETRQQLQDAAATFIDVAHDAGIEPVEKQKVQS